MKRKHRGRFVGLIHQGIRGISRLLLGMPILRVLSLPTSRHHLAGSCRVDRSKRERLDDVFIPGLL
ncbi:BnaCnng12450D [Brassica napus]|uniref:BnaCnng12450D protein n=1 Tax=Brassica napus TaxID=3708 RepID=A0A078I6H7_BRANA|nr:BnaCnng12450D [Brassica napus]